MDEYITPNYETISTSQKRTLCELMGSSLINAFTEQDYIDVLKIFERLLTDLKCKRRANDMPRYIDADALMEELRSLQVYVTGIRCGKGYLSTIVREYQKSVLKIVHDQPDADVVPREEVEALKAELDDLKRDTLPKLRWSLQRANEMGVALEKDLANAKSEVEREIFAEINAIKKEYASGDIDGNELYVRLYMLEKKYTEEKRHD